MAPPVDKPRDSFTRPDEEGAFAPALSASSPLAAEEQDLSKVQTRKLTDQGIRDAEGWGLVNGGNPLAAFASRWRTVSTLIRNVSSDLQESQAKGDRVPASERWFLENARLLETLSQGISDTVNTLRGPAVQGEGNALVPRAYAVAAGYLQAVDMLFTERTLALYLAGIQQVESLTMSELWALKPMLEFVLLEQFTAHAESVYSHRESGGRGRSSSNARRTGRVETAVRAVRLMQEVDWKEFFEQNDAAELILRQDPSGAYPQMDDESRQMYRQVVEGLARQSLRSEEEVVRAAVHLAARAKDQAGALDARMAIHQTHVGYYLIGAGSRNFKKQLGYKPSAKQRIVDLILDWPEVYYIVGVELTTIVLVLFLLQDLRIIIPLIPGLLLLIPASHAAIGIVNYLTSFLVSPRRIPKLDYSEGIPQEATTLVVVPCLLLSEAEVHRNVESLEIRYLANRDPNLHFALLTDSPDASQAFDEHDALVGICSALIDQLNQRYAQDKGGRFLHLHRHRVYNPSEGTWMGWERKRGKLMDLNRLLRGGFDSFPVKAGDVSVFPSVRYVITLDSDTKLPPGAAERLIGSLAHPLNRAVIDPTTNTVVEGYTILQPRVSVSVESSRHSRLAAIYSGQTGFDIYTQAISDVYQDLFGEGTFTGKGIYEVDTFQRVLENRFPTNALLSHDLMEGAYARTGLVSDIAVIDDYPSHFSAYSRRLHRWVRGDWQIMWWLLPQVPDHNGHRVPNPLTFTFPLEDLRQPATKLERHWLVPAADPRLGGSSGRSCLLDPGYARVAVDAHLLPAFICISSHPQRAELERLSAGTGERLRVGPSAGLRHARLPSSPGTRHAGCHHPDAHPPYRDPAQAARVGNRGGGRIPEQKDSRRDLLETYALSFPDDWLGSGPASPRRAACCRADLVPLGTCRFLYRLAQSPTGRRSTSVDQRRRRFSSAGRAPHLALFPGVQHPGKPLAHTR